MNPAPDSPNLTPAPRQKHAFISYAHEDARLAIEFATALHKTEVPFVIGTLLIEPGDSLTGKIGDALNDASALIALISEHSIQSRWVKRELATVDEMGIQVIPVRCDKIDWPPELRLHLADRHYVDVSDKIDAAAKVAKTCVRATLAASFSPRLNSFFPILTSRTAPCCRVYPGSLEAALDDVAFGRVLLVIPTNRGVDLNGKVGSAVLDHLNLNPADLKPTPLTIRSDQLSTVCCTTYKDLDILLCASTVFNDLGSLRAKDQHLAAAAVMSTGVKEKCTVALIPPMGTGAYNWPGSSAVFHWLFGAIRWAKSTVTTFDAVWPIICQPGHGAAQAISKYLSTLDSKRIEALASGYFCFLVEYNGQSRPSGPIRFDAFLGSIVVAAFPELRESRRLRVKPPQSVLKRQPSAQSFELGTRVNDTPFADGDLLEVMAS